jgi:hypothetical protein
VREVVRRYVTTVVAASNGTQASGFEMLVSFSAARQKVETERDPDTRGADLDFASLPLVLVDSFHFASAQCEGKVASMTVTFTRVGRYSGNGAIEAEPRHSETVSYHAVLGGRGWRVLDPPTPRVLATALGQFFISESAIFCAPGRAKGGTGDRCKEVRRGQNALARILPDPSEMAR